VVHEETIKRDAYPSPLNYQLFPKSCCVSVNEVICHGIPDQYALQDGDLVNIDVSCYFDGFHADLNETCLVGQVDAAGIRLVDETREALKKAIEMGISLHCFFLLVGSAC
jgi:methionyl aminopeptidase